MNSADVVHQTSNVKRSLLEGYTYEALPTKVRNETVKLTLQLRASMDREMYWPIYWAGITAFGEANDM